MSPLHFSSTPSHCDRCRLPYPAEMLNPLMMNGRYTGPVCGICALEMTNEMHDGKPRKAFQGEMAEEFRQRAISWRKKHPNAQKIKSQPFHMWVVSIETEPPTAIGRWLVSWDFEAREGRGDGQFSEDRSLAMKFDSVMELLEFWKTQCTSVPKRPDGRPNRSLTAYTVQPVREDQEPLR